MHSTQGALPKPSASEALTLDRVPVNKVGGPYCAPCVNQGAQTTGLCFILSCEVESIRGLIEFGSALKIKLSIKMRHKLLSVLFFLTATWLFAIHDATSKYLTTYFAVPLLIWARYLVYLLIMLVTVAPRIGRKVVVTHRPWLMILRALMLVGVSILFQNCLKIMPLAEATALVYVTPLLVAVMAGPMLGEKLRLIHVIATVAGFVGVLIIARPGGSISGLGVAYGLGAAFCYTAFQLLTRKLSTSEPVMRQIFYTALVGTVAMSFFVPVYWTGELPTLNQALLIISLGFCAGIGQFLFTRAFHEIPASTLSPLLNIQLVWAMLLGWAIFGQLPDLITVVGMLIIGASCLSIALLKQVHSK